TRSETAVGACAITSALAAKAGAATPQPRAVANKPVHRRWPIRTRLFITANPTVVCRCLWKDRVLNCYFRGTATCRPTDQHGSHGACIDKASRLPKKRTPPVSRKPLASANVHRSRQQAKG